MAYQQEGTFRNTSSHAAVGGHPVHPMLVPIAIGMYVAAVCADVGFARSGDPFWARGASWLLLAALLAGLTAAIPGIIDLLSIDEARALPAAWMHAGGNGLFLVVTALNYAERQPDPAATGSGGILLSFTGLLLLGVSGWFGGEMTYRHGIGVVEQRQREK